MRRALILVPLLALLGCSGVEPSVGRRDPNWPQYTFCVSHGGDWTYEGWNGDYSCDLPPKGGTP